jgi:hypothetical protein
MLLLFLILLLLFPKIALASGEFNITQNITYTVNQQGIASIHQEVNLTNNFSQIYAKEYQITLTGSDLKNITGSDSSGNIIDSLQNLNDQTLINLKFSDPAIGKDQSKKFSLDYSITDFAKKKGNTWEIQFPVFAASQDTPQTNVSLTVPSSFGDLSFSSVPIGNVYNLSDTTQLNFNQNQLGANKILLVFGNHQLFDFQLNYYLKNSENYDINTEIPLPPDTNSQTIILKSLTPSPSTITTDTDGNWLAQYFIAKNQNLNVTITGQAKIHPPVASIEPPPAGTEYLSSQKYWPVADPQITAISQKLTSPKSIYRYVVNALNYDYNNIDTAIRKGALFAINSPDTSLCTEFTDLFVTLSRSKNISAREIEGFAYSNNSKIKPTNVNSDILHAWPEYYDPAKQQWLQVDPTWEKTTNGIDYFSDLDLNHLTFVIHGLHSDSPSPPGSYKENSAVKSVFVDFATEELKPGFVSPKLTLNGRILTVRNPNLFSLHSLNLNLSDFNFKTSLNSLPPLSSVDITLPSVSFFQSVLPQFQKYKISLTLAETGNPVSYQLTNQQHYFNLIISLGSIIFLLCLGGIILTASHKSNEKNS